MQIKILLILSILGAYNFSANSISSKSCSNEIAADWTSFECLIRLSENIQLKIFKWQEAQAFDFREALDLLRRSKNSIMELVQLSAKGKCREIFSMGLINKYQQLMEDLTKALQEFVEKQVDPEIKKVFTDQLNEVLGFSSDGYLASSNYPNNL